MREPGWIENGHVARGLSFIKRSITIIRTVQMTETRVAPASHHQSNHIIFSGSVTRVRILELCRSVGVGDELSCCRENRTNRRGGFDGNVGADALSSGVWKSARRSPSPLKDS